MNKLIPIPSLEDSLCLSQERTEHQQQFHHADYQVDQERSEYQRELDHADHKFAHQLYRQKDKDKDNSFQKEMDSDYSEYLKQKQHPSLVSQVLRSTWVDGGRNTSSNNPNNKYEEPPQDAILRNESSTSETQDQARSIDNQRLSDDTNRSIFDYLAEHRRRMDLLSTSQKEGNRIANNRFEQDAAFDSIHEDQHSDDDDLIFEIDL